MRKSSIILAVSLFLFVSCIDLFNPTSPEDENPTTNDGTILPVDSGPPTANDVHEGANGNNSPSYASLFSAGSFTNLVILDGEDDWYKIPVAFTNYKVKVTIYYTGDSSSAATENLYVRVYDDYYGTSSYSKYSKNYTNYQESNYSFSSPDSVEALGKSADTIYVEVAPISNYSSLDCNYSMKIEISAISDDTYEQNDSYSQYKTLSLGNTYDLVFLDEDYFKIPIGNSGSNYVKATITYSYYYNNMIQLEKKYSYSGSTESYYNCDADTNEFLLNCSGDTLYLMIDNVYSYVGTEYTLTLDTLASADDSLENNDSREDAVDINPGITADLYAVQGDTDWYSFTAEANSQITIKIAADYSTYNYYLYGYLYRGSSSSSVDYESLGSDDTLELTYYTSYNETFHLRVFNNYYSYYSYSNEIIPYTITLDVTTLSNADDSYEDNDTQSDAAAIDTGKTTDLKAIYNDADWYRFSVEPNSQITVKIAADYSTYSSYLYGYLYGPSSTSYLDYESLNYNDTLELSYFSANGGTYYLRTSNSSSSTSNLIIPYTADINIHTITLSDDSLENNDSKTAAASISAGITQDLYAVKGDTDWYAFSVPANNMITVKVARDYSAYSTYLRMYLYKESSSSYLAYEYSESDDTLEVSYFANSSETYYLRIYNSYSYSTISYMEIPYTINIGLADVGNIDDSLENNDSKFAASGIAVGRTDSLVMLEDDEDWYKVGLMSNEQLSVKVFLDQTSISYYDQISLLLYNVSSSSYLDHDIVQYTYTADTLTVDYISSTAETIYVQVDYSYTSTSSSIKYEPYSMIVAKNIIPDDRYENNDSKFNASLVTAGTYDSLILLNNDMDWYKIGAAANEYLTIRMDYDYQNNGYSYPYLYIYNSTSSSYLDYDGGTYRDSAEIKYLATQTDTYYVAVDIYNSTSSSYNIDMLDYSLTVEKSSLLELDDAMEQNDTYLTASTIMPDTTYQLVSVKNDTDWYKIVLSPNDLFDITLQFTESANSYTDLYMYLLDSAFNQISYDYDDYPANLTITNRYTQTGGTYYIRVQRTTTNVSYQEMAASYSLHVSRTNTSTLDDSYEDNDNAANAAVIVNGYYDSLSYYDEDWFAINMSAGVPMRLDVISDTTISSSFYLALLDANQTLVQSTSGSSTQIGFNYTPTTTGTYYIRFYYNSSSSYSFLDYYGLRVMPQ